MSRAALDIVRRDMVLDPLARVRVELDSEGAQMVVRFRCATCDDRFEWDEEARWWVCQTCGIELTPREADVVLGEVKRAVKKSISDVSVRRGRWDWVRWLLRRNQTGR